MDPAIAFGLVLRRLRKEAGLTQEKLALDAGIDRNFVSLIERGINQPTIRILFKLADILQIQPSKILRQVEIELERAQK
ncbi:MAG TPA: helix-turn-helix transcriptional regulator [Burkholderiaceae bacterium]